MQIIGIWVAAFLTLSIYSFLYKDNPLYRFAEHLFIGISVGYGIVLAIHQGFIPLAWKPFWQAITLQNITGIWVIIPIAFGLLFFARLSPRHTWLIRYPIAILIGYGSGIAITNVLRANIFEQTRGTLVPFGKMTETIAPNGEIIPALTTFEIFSAILMVIGVVCTLTYFFFSVEHRGPIKGMSKIGIAFLMIGFGSAFGNTVMGRVALLIQRVDFLMFEWIASIGTIFSWIF